jgi:putative hemolysin
MNAADTIAWFGLALAGVSGSALCSGTETGLYSINRVRLSVRAALTDGGGSAAILNRELEHPNRALATLLIANTLFGSLTATGISALLQGAGYSEGAVVALNVLILTPLLFIFGETLPKEVFRRDADRLTYRAAPFLALARLVLTWTLLLPAIEAAVRAVSRLLGVGGEVNLASAREHIAALLKEGARHGVLSAAQTTLLDRALALRNTTVEDEAVPWEKVQLIHAGWPRQRVLALLAERPFSCFPVTGPHGALVGVVDHLDICLGGDVPIESIARPPTLLDADLPVREGLLRLREAGAHLGVVVRRWSGGGTADARPIGIVTTKDLIEPLTGELAQW